MFTGDTVDTQAAKPIGFASSGSQLVVNVNPSNFKDDASMNEDRDPWGVRVVGRWWGIPTITPSDSGREYLGSCVPYIKMILCGLNSGDRSSQLCTRLSRPGSRFSPSPLHLDCTAGVFTYHRVRANDIVHLDLHRCGGYHQSGQYVKGHVHAEVHSEIE